MGKRLAALLALLLVAACDAGPPPILSDEDEPLGPGEEPGDPDGSADPAADGGVAPTTARGCREPFTQGQLPTFEIEIASADWQALLEDAARGVERLQAGEDIHPYRPLIAFKHGDTVKRDAAIRLRGNPLWWTTRKMQFQISFNEHDRAGRFLGLRKIVLDSAPQNQSFLRDRLALSVMRDLGVDAPCANNARLVVNGAYYGLYTNIEKLDREFLERVYGKRYADGNLWKRKNWTIQTNEETATRERLQAVLAARDPGRLCELLDCPAALLEWAGEAVLPDADGAWVGALNYYLYDHPTRGFIVLPWDLDATFTRLPADTDPLRYVKAGREHGRPHYDLLVADPTWRRRYLEALDRAVAAYAVSELQRRIDEWSAQIGDAAAADRNKPFATARQREAVTELRAYVAERRAYLEGWLAAEPR
jgi:hypothetical protein